MILFFRSLAPLTCNFSYIVFFCASSFSSQPPPPPLLLLLLLSFKLLRLLFLSLFIFLLRFLLLFYSLWECGVCMRFYMSEWVYMLVCSSLYSNWSSCMYYVCFPYAACIVNGAGVKGEPNRIRGWGGMVVVVMVMARWSQRRGEEWRRAAIKTTHTAEENTGKNNNSNNKYIRFFRRFSFLHHFLKRERQHFNARSSSPLSFSLDSSFR